MARTMESVLTEVNACASATEGTGFSEKLNRAAYTLGGLVASEALPLATAEDALRQAADHARPRQTARNQQIITSGLNAGRERPFVPGARP